MVNLRGAWVTRLVPSNWNHAPEKKKKTLAVSISSLRNTNLIFNQYHHHIFRDGTWIVNHQPAHLVQNWSAVPSKRPGCWVPRRSAFGGHSWPGDGIFCAVSLSCQVRPVSGHDAKDGIMGDYHYIYIYILYIERERDHKKIFLKSHLPTLFYSSIFLGLLYDIGIYIGYIMAFEGWVQHTAWDETRNTVAWNRFSQQFWCRDDWTIKMIHIFLRWGSSVPMPKSLINRLVGACHWARAVEPGIQSLQISQACLAHLLLHYPLSQKKDPRELTWQT